MIHLFLEKVTIGVSVLICCLAYGFIVYKFAKNSARHWSSLPGVFMGIGILFTFLTIYDTFNYIPYLEDKVTINTTKLIKMIGSGFLGSIVGLFLSIIATPFVKVQINRIDNEEQKAAGEENNPYKLLQFIVNNTNETHIAIDGLKNELVRLLGVNNDELKASKTILKDFTDKTEQFNANLFNELIEKLEKAVRDMSNEAITKSLGNLENINNDLSKNLKTVFSDTGNTITQGQSDLKESIDDLKTALEGKIDTINQQTTQDASLAKETVTITLGEIKTQVANMGSSIAAQAQGVIDAKLESINTTFNTIEDKQKKAVQVQSEIVEKMQSVFTEMEKAFNTKIEEINTATNEIQGKIIDMGNNITEKADKIVGAKIQSLEQTFERIEKYQRRSETILKEVTNKFGKSVTQVEYINDKRKEEFEKLEKQSETLEGTIETTNQIYENWQETINAIKDIETKLASINNVIRNIDELNSKFHDYFPSTKQN